MTVPLDTSFDFKTDTPAGKDADSHSPTLRRYHQFLWSKPLPAGPTFSLRPEPRAYLVHRSATSVVYLASDAITTMLRRRAWRVIREVPDDAMPEDLGYTMGSSIIFPGSRIDGQATINGARGFHPRIADRFDLTLECIRRHYLGEDSPLASTLLRYRDFFALFDDFSGYVNFFHLQDLAEDDGQTVRFFHAFDNFRTPAVPRTVGEYIRYARASNNFIQLRNRRIDAYVTRRAHRDRYRNIDHREL